MTAVGVLCIILGSLLSFAIALGTRSFSCVLLFLYHTAASVLYWLYSLRQPADSFTYYQTPYDPYTEIRPGTLFVRWLTALLRDLLGASYLDMFMLYHIAGYLGVIVLYLLCRRIVGSNADPDPDSKPPYLVYIVAFLPGLHVWTSAIGKDGLMFLGISCVLWGASQRRGLAVLAGIALCAMIRPHIACLLAGSCGAALVLSGDIPLHWRAGLLCLLTAGLWLGLPYLQEFLKLEELNSASVVDYMEQRQGANLEGGSSVNIADYSWPMQLFTFLYRPLFIDAKGTLGLVVSLENAFYLGISLLHVPKVVGLLSKGSDTFFLKFNLLYWLAGSAVLAHTTSNLGLAIRQKTMVVPSLIVISLIAYARERQGGSRVAGVENDSLAPHLTNHA